MDKQESRDYSRRWYAEHPEYRKRKLVLQSERIRRTVKWLRAEKAKRGCAVCAERDPVVLDFHHRDPSTKSFSLGGAVGLHLGHTKLIREMAKCDVLCSNCHRRRHANRV